MRNAEGSVVRSRSRPRGTGIVRFPSRRSGVARQPLESFRKRVYNNASVHQRRCARLLFWKTRGGGKEKKGKGERKRETTNRSELSLFSLLFLAPSLSLSSLFPRSLERVSHPRIRTHQQRTRARAHADAPLCASVLSVYGERARDLRLFCQPSRHSRVTFSLSLSLYLFLPSPPCVYPSLSPRIYPSVYLCPTALLQPVSLLSVFL